MSNPLEIHQLSKHYKSQIALDSIDLVCPAGSIVGLLGPNGSGKTTLLKSIAGLCLPSSGNVNTLGIEARDLEQAQLCQLGFVQQEAELFDWLKVSEHLRYVASYYKNWDKQREDHLLEAFNLDPKAKVAALSTGDRQKLAIILAVCHHPKLLLLDEPASALDPEVRAKLLKFLIEIARDDETSVIISSHILVDVEKVIDHVWFLRSGKLISDMDLDGLKESYAEWTVSAASGQVLPERFDESYVLKEQGDSQQRILIVSDPAGNEAVFESKYGVSLDSRSLNLEAIYPLLSQSLVSCQNEAK